MDKCTDCGKDVSRYEAIGCESLWNVDNGITTCSRCHCLIDPSRERFGVKI